MEEQYQAELKYLQECGLTLCEAMAILLIALEYEKPRHGKYGVY